MSLPAQRITVDASCAIGSTLDFFVATGSLQPPIATFADNSRFPPVRALYARPMTLGAKNGVHITAVLDQHPVATSATDRRVGLAVNVFQTDMTGDFSVVPDRA